MFQLGPHCCSAQLIVFGVAIARHCQVQKKVLLRLVSPDRLSCCFAEFMVDGEC